MITAASSHGAGIDAQAFQALTDQLKVMTDSLIATQKDLAENKAVTLELRANNAKLAAKVNTLAEFKVDTSSCKSEGNQAQYDSNLSVIGDLTNALIAIETDDLQGLDGHIRSGIKTLMARNKLIRLVDRSEAGWAFAKEYETSHLASDDEDDRKIRRSETAAVTKVTHRKEGRSTRGGHRGRRGRGHPYAQNYSGYDYNNNNSQTPAWAAGSAQQAYENDYQHNSPNPYYAQHPQRQPYGQSGRGRRMGPCFECSGPHMVNACPELFRRSGDVQNRIEAQYRR